MPTTRNAKGVDVVIYSQSADKKFTIQVKALSKRNPVPLGSSLNGLIADFVVICTNVADTAVPNTYIATPAEIARVAHRGEKNGNVSFWLQPPDYASFLNRWDLVGLGY